MAKRPLNESKITGLFVEAGGEGMAKRLDSAATLDPDALHINAGVDSIVRCLKDFDEIVSEGTPEERKEFVRLFVEGIELDGKKGKAVARIKKFPAPKDLDTGKLSFGLVAGARSEHQKIPFPPVDVVEIPLERRGNVLVPVAA